MNTQHTDTNTTPADAGKTTQHRPMYLNEWIHRTMELDENIVYTGTPNGMKAIRKHQTVGEYNMHDQTGWYDKK